AGIQYRRIVSPMGVPRSTRVTRSLSSRDSMVGPSSLGWQIPTSFRYAENPPKETRRQAKGGAIMPLRRCERGEDTVPLPAVGEGRVRGACELRGHTFMNGVP